MKKSQITALIVLFLLLVGASTYSIFSAPTTEKILIEYQEEIVKEQNNITRERMEREEKKKAWQELDSTLSGSINDSKARIKKLQLCIEAKTLDCETERKKLSAFIENSYAESEHEDLIPPLNSGTAHSEPTIADPGYNNLLISTTYGNTHNDTLNASNSRVGNPDMAHGIDVETEKQGSDNGKQQELSNGPVQSSQGEVSNGSETSDGGEEKKGGSQSQTSTASIQSANNRNQDQYFWKVYEIAVPMIQKYEGLRLHAYRDGVGCSIGWGTVATHCDEVISEAEANKRFASIIRQVVLRIRANHPNLTARQQAGLVSFAYNCEQGYKDVLARGLSVHQYWCKSYQGKRLSGLVARRNEEAEMLFR